MSESVAVGGPHEESVGKEATISVSAIGAMVTTRLSGVLLLN